jgi:uncharacterized phage protein gp47/JayE
MPYARKTLSQLRAEVAQDITSALPGSDALLRFSNLKIVADAQANLANLHYGYLDWIAKQSNPFTATDEFLEAWAALKDVFRKSATSASGYITFPAITGTMIPVGTGIVRGDGITYTSTSSITAGSGGLITVPATADADPTGLTGAFGDSTVNTAMTLGAAIAGIQSNGYVSTAFTGGADLESDDSLRSRMLQAYQNPPQGGAQSDYITWALQVAGVTRAWCSPNALGPGTVVVYVMLDITQAAHNGFPQGGNGVAAADTRAPSAAGDQLLVANYIYPLQPVTAEVHVVAPGAHSINFSISGVPVGVQASVAAAIDDVFLRVGSPGGTVPLAQVNSAIASVSGSGNFLIVSPVLDITNGAGLLPVRGTIAWS